MISSRIVWSWSLFFLREVFTFGEINAKIHFRLIFFHYIANSLLFYSFGYNFVYSTWCSCALAIIDLMFVPFKVVFKRVGLLIILLQTILITQMLLWLL